MEKTTTNMFSADNWGFDFGFFSLFTKHVCSCLSLVCAKWGEQNRMNNALSRYRLGLELNLHLLVDRTFGWSATLGWCYGEFIVVDQEAILRSLVLCFVSFDKWLCAIGRIFVKTFGVTNDWIWLVTYSVHYEMITLYAPFFIWKCHVSSWVLNGRL
jgi:hypothetical protein